MGAPLRVDVVLHVKFVGGYFFGIVEKCTEKVSGFEVGFEVEGVMDLDDGVHFGMGVGEVLEDGFDFGLEWLFSNIEEEAGEVGNVIDSDFIEVLVIESSVE